MIIIDYGMGNLRSIQKVFIRMNIECRISSKIDDIVHADKLILPGVGHFKTAMNNLKELDLIDVLTQKVMIDKIPILGICLGAQLFADYSEEGHVGGLGWIDAKVVRFSVSDNVKFKIPHIGWNDNSIENSCKIDRLFDNSKKFYFVHSYHLKCNKNSEIWMTSEYDYKFVSAVHKENIYGTQFHPEKSHEAGNDLLRAFAEL